MLDNSEHFCEGGKRVLDNLKGSWRGGKRVLDNSKGSRKRGKRVLEILKGPKTLLGSKTPFPLTHTNNKNSETKKRSCYEPLILYLGSTQLHGRFDHIL